MTVVCVVQGHMASTRYPGKTAQMLGDMTVLGHVLARCQLIKGVDQVVAAIADTSGNEILIDIAAGVVGVAVFLGADRDPLSRTLGAARMGGCVNPGDVVMRITSDCPMTDPKVSAAVLDLYRTEKGYGAIGYPLYASNVRTRTYPHGLDCEVFDFVSLVNANEWATSSHDREHVTPYIQRNTSRGAYLRNPSADLSKHRWVVDYPSDLAFMRTLYAVAGKLPLHMEETLAVLAAHPSLAPAVNPRAPEWDGQDMDGLGR